MLLYVLAFTSKDSKNVKIGNFIITMNGDHALPRHLKNNPGYSANLPRLIAHTKEKYPDLKMIDVGANIGDTVALVQTIIPNIPILCIEGDEKYFKLLSKNLSKFKNTKACQCFLGEKDGTVNGTLVSNEGTLHVQEKREEKPISITTLDIILKKYNNFSRAHIIKIDTDGYDVKIIRGGWKYLSEEKPVLFFEWDRFFLQNNKDDGVDILLALAKIGYERVLFYDNLGRFLVSCTLKETETIKQLYYYAYRKTGSFPYYDIAVFSKEDNLLALSFIQKEMDLQNKNTF